MTQRHTTRRPAPLTTEGGRAAFTPPASWPTRRPRRVSPAQRCDMRMAYKQLYPGASDRAADVAVARWFAQEWGHPLSEGTFEEGIEAISVLRAFAAQEGVQ